MYINKFRFIHIVGPSLKCPKVHINNGSHTYKSELKTMAYAILENLNNQVLNMNQVLKNFSFNKD